MNRSLSLVVERSGERVLLQAPEAGIFTCSLPPGSALAPGQEAGVLVRLGRAACLVVPAGVNGLVTSPRPERVQAPVGAGDVLYELAPIADLEAGAETATGAEGSEGSEERGLAVYASQAGRFYASPSPSDPPFVSVGTELKDGVAVGLIEVMKTFTQILYRPEGNLPDRARVTRVLVPDGGDVAVGQALIEVEDAQGTGAGG